MNPKTFERELKPSAGFFGNTIRSKPKVKNIAASDT
jgi:hypothetical protein